MKNKKNVVVGLILVAIIAVGFYFWSGRNGRFVLTGDTIEPRAGHTATLMQDGRVLVTGGEITGSSVIKTPSFHKILKSAEIYDPSTNKFTKTGDMTSPRTRHAAVLLKDGRVLITGGAIDGKHTSEYLKLAEIYDPKTEKFTKINDMNHAWNSHNMILLPDGRVLLCSNISNLLINSRLEIFDSNNNTFKEMPPCITTYCPDNAALLNDGTVLLASDEFPNNRPQIFNPETRTFKYTGKMTHYRSFSTATLLKDGEVIIIGGGTRGGFASTEIYNPKTGLFRLAAKINQKRYGHSSILLSTGKVLVVGGDTGMDESLRGIKSVELYDPQEDKFIKVMDMHYIREYKPTLTFLKNENVLIMGGGKRPELYISK